MKNSFAIAKIISKLCCLLWKGWLNQITWHITLLMWFKQSIHIFSSERCGLKTGIPVPMSSYKKREEKPQLLFSEVDSFSPLISMTHREEDYTRISVVASNGKIHWAQYIHTHCSLPIKIHSFHPCSSIDAVAIHPIKKLVCQSCLTS